MQHIVIRHSTGVKGPGGLPVGARCKIQGDDKGCTDCSPAGTCAGGVAVAAAAGTGAGTEQWLARRGAGVPGGGRRRAPAGGVGVAWRGRRYCLSAGAGLVSAGAGVGQSSGSGGRGGKVRGTKSREKKEGGVRDVTRIGSMHTGKERGRGMGDGWGSWIHHRRYKVLTQMFGGKADRAVLREITPRCPGRSAPGSSSRGLCRPGVCP